MRKPKRRPSTILVKQGNRVVIDYEQQLVIRLLRGDYSIMRFDEFRQLTPTKIAAWYRHLGYAEIAAPRKTGRAQQYPNQRQCIEAGCTARAWNESYGGKTIRRARCMAHHKALKAQRAQKRAA